MMDCSSTDHHHHPLDDEDDINNRNHNNETIESYTNNNQSLNNDNESLQQKLKETEEKLLKFKNFVLTLRNERNQLKEKVNNDNQVIEKLKAQVKKSQNCNQLFHNFQQLQNEYDKSQDEIEQYKKRTKQSDLDLAKCVDEMNQLKVINDDQKDTIRLLQLNQSQQDIQIDMQKETIKEYESKIIVLETKLAEKDVQVHDYEMKINESNELQQELKSKNDIIEQLSVQLAEQTEQLEKYSDEICDQKKVIEKYAVLEKENVNLAEEYNKNKHIIQSNCEEIEKFKQNESKLQSTIEMLEKSMNDFRVLHTEKIAALELENYDLKNKLQFSETDLRNNREKFDEYKSKVAITLKENKMNHGDYSRQIESLNLRLENLQEENEKLRNESEKLSVLVDQLKIEKRTMQTQLTTLNDQLNDLKTLRKNFDLLNTENDKLNQTLKQLQISFARERSQISETNREQLEQLRSEYENRIKNLEEELANQRNIVANHHHHQRQSSDDSNSVINSNTSFEEIKEENCSIRSNVSSSLERNFLEEILSTGSKSPTPANGQNFDNLTHLLAESETNINLLSEQNRVLKEEIRRLHRSIDRMDIANNLEYLKNVLLKFMTIKRQDEKERLINVLSIILKLTTEETAIFNEFLPENLPNSNKSLTSSWNLWQWS
ncbi:GRIP and coiled-coil domain-containing protein 2 [Dermatophagoides farinae]|uniref:GRIP and coiled-coil domain-containing protein 2 n=1 Tax=Dermatophagoides farinae TaxID=6954 RepID=A0A922IAA9_DERFA|nr:hypothetical protein HUG17_4541 [Dermatophagoides farinae]KAH9527315.1 GRIP and coiled-coil domain-containing protein 2 [Dermatophagoides farinae]